MTLNADQLAAITQEARLCFLYEDAPDYLADLDQGLALLPRDPQAAYGSLMRTAHSLKGGAGIAQLLHLSQLAHQMEDVLEALHQGRVRDPQPAHRLLQQAIQGIPELVGAAVRGGEGAEAATAAEMPIFAALQIFCQGIPPELEDHAQAEENTPNLFILKTALSVDLEDCLQRAEAALGSPTQSQALADLREGCLLLGQALGLSWLQEVEISERDPGAGLASLRQQRDQALATLEDRVAAPQGSPGQTPDIAPEIQAPEIQLRIPVPRLDRMNDGLGELFILQERLGLYQTQFQGSSRQLQQKMQQFHSLNERIQSVYDRLATPLARSIPGEFDPLEMDTYTDLHSTLQDFQELMVRVQESRADIDLVNTDFQQALDEVRRQLDDVRGEMTAARLVPFRIPAEKLASQVLTLSQQFDKPVHTRILGSEALVDQAILEQLGIPLNHLIRNAFDHGIEPPNERRAAGKDPVGQITLGVRVKSDRMILTLQDDGRGLDYERIRARAVEQGLIPSDTQLSERDLAELLFMPGFSTAATVTHLSGRGVGMDIVRLQVERLRGLIEVSSQRGLGTTWILSFPLTLNILPLLLCRCGGRLVGIPSTEVLSAISLKEYADQIQNNTLRWQSHLAPVCSLLDLLPYATPLDPTIPDTLGLVVQGRGSLLVLTVEALVGERELTLKPMDPTLPAPPYISGCTVLGTGEVVPVLAVEHLQPELAGIRPHVEPLPQSEMPTVLIAEDSVAVRGMLERLLRQSGYRVLSCRDGKEAMAEITKGTGSLSLVITDIEMPGFDGFQVLEAVQQRDPRLPVLMLTSRAGELHRQKAQKLGSSGYFTKPFQAGVLLERVAALIQRPV